MMKIQRKIVITCLVVLMAVAAFSGVGYAYTAMTVNSGNTSTSEYTVISQSTYTYSPSGSMDYYSVGASGAYTVKVGTGAESGTLKKAEDCFMSLHERCISTVVIKGGAYDGTYTIDMSSNDLELVTSGGSAGTAGVTQVGTGVKDAAMDSSGIRYTFTNTGANVIKMKVKGTAETSYTIHMPNGCEATGFDASTDALIVTKSYTANSVTFTCPDVNEHVLGISVTVSEAKGHPVTCPKGLTFSLNSVVQNTGVTAAVDSNNIKYTFDEESEYNIRMKVKGEQGTSYTIHMPNGCTIRGVHNATDAKIRNLSVTSGSVTLTCPDANEHLLVLTVDASQEGEYIVAHPNGMTFSLNGVVQNDVGPLDFTAISLSYDGVRFDNVAIGNNITVVYDELAKKYTITGKLKYQANEDGDAMDKLGMPEADHYGVSFLVNYSKAALRYFVIDTSSKHSIELFNGYYGKKIGPTLNDMTISAGSVKVKCPDTSAHVLALTVDAVQVDTDYVISHPDGMTFSLTDVVQESGVTATMDSSNVKYRFTSAGSHVIKMKVTGAANGQYIIDMPGGGIIRGINNATDGTLTCSIKNSAMFTCPDNGTHILTLKVDAAQADTNYVISHPNGMTFSLTDVVQGAGVTATMVNDNKDVQYSFSTVGKHVIKVKISGTKDARYSIGMPDGCTVSELYDSTANTLTINNVGTERTNKVTISSDDGFAKLYGGWRYILKITNNDTHAVQYAMSDGGDWIYYHYVDGKWLQEKYLEMFMNTNGYDTELFIAGPSAHIEYDYASGTAELKYTGEVTNSRGSNDLVKNGTITFRYDSTYE